MDPYILFQQLGISLLLGLLVGLQRERMAHGRPGLRTFPLITVFGTVCAILANTYGGWILVGGLFGVALVIVVQHLLVHLLERRVEIGSTTDMAALMMFAVGALLVAAPLPVGVAVGGGVAVLLQFKFEMHRFAERLGDADLKAIMQFVIITFIILPILPDETFGPFDVWNPRETWMLVALIVGMGLFAYIAYKFFGRNAGILLGGILGGAISSTATAVSYSRQAKNDPNAGRIASIVIMIASTIVFIRVLAEIAVVSQEFLLVAAPPVLILAGFVLVPSLAIWFRARTEPSKMPEQGNPTQLKSALTFAALYAAMLFAMAATNHYVGDQGLYFVAAFSGATDMDAVTITISKMAKDDPAVMATGWRLIIIGAMSNLVFKASIIGVLGGKQLFKRIVILFSIPMVGGLLLLLFY
jgi:uncharacterized membrane protein (DUF4010 family)